jgi:hypothetical protein
MNVMKKKQFIMLNLVACLVLAAVPIASGAVGTVIDWGGFSGGGGSASSGSVSLNGSLGQPVVGVSSAGETQLSAGFWHVQAVGPLPYQVMLPLVVR